MPGPHLNPSRLSSNLKAGAAQVEVPAPVGIDMIGYVLLAGQHLLACTHTYSALAPRVDEQIVELVVQLAQAASHAMQEE
jgi:hypothetical protein